MKDGGRRRRRRRKYVKRDLKKYGRNENILQIFFPRIWNWS
jgi:hypothetical protein